MTTILAKLKKYFNIARDTAVSQHPAPPSYTAPTLSDDNLQRLMHLLEHTHEGMYSCQETFDLLDEYVELVANHEDAARLMPYVQRHLDRCPDCHEAYEILLRILQTESPPLA